MAADLSRISEIAGFVSACLVDTETGLMLASQGGGGLDLEAVSALYAKVVRSERDAIEGVGLSPDVEDIMITLGNQIHLIRPLGQNSDLFLYLSVDRTRTNPGMARLHLEAFEAEFDLGI